MIKNHQGFTNEFLDSFLSLGFGSMNKKDVELITLKYIVNQHISENNGELDYFELSKALRITEPRLKSLVKDMQARYFYDVYDNGEFKKRLVQILENKKFHIEGEKLKLSPNDPMFTQYMHKYAFKLNTFIDGSFNPEIIVLKIDDFLKIISLIIKDDTDYLELFNTKEHLDIIRNSDINNDIKINIEQVIIENNKTSSGYEYSKIKDYLIPSIPAILQIILLMLK